MDIREANESDIDFIAWVGLTASRSHLARGLWEWLDDHTEEQTLELLRGLATANDVQMCHYSRFLIAEVNGTPAAALCGFDPVTQGMDAMMRAAPPLAAALGVVFDDAWMARSAALGNATPPYEEGAWVVENVATVPEFRRQGLVDGLLKAILDRGRAQGHEVAQIGVFLGNEPARKAYLKAGFEYKDEARDPVFEAGLGCPGIERFLQSL